MERLHRRELISEVRAGRDRAVSALASLHTRLRALAADLGAVATEDPVEDVRRAAEGMREVVSAAAEQARRADEEYVYVYRNACVLTNDAARRLAAAREKP